MVSSGNQNFQPQNSQPGSGLLRFRSAPSSFLANFNEIGVANDSSVLSFQELEDKSGVKMRQSAVNYGNSTSCCGLPPHYPRHNNSATNFAAMDESYGLIGSIGLTHSDQPKRMDSNLARQNSSPAGFLANISLQDGSIKRMGSYRGANGTNGEVSPRLKTQLSFPQRVPSSLSMLSQIAEVGDGSIDVASPDNRKLGNGQLYSSSGISSYDSWNKSNFPENFNDMKSDPDDIGKLYPNPRNVELGKRNMLSHHLSLPKTSTDMTAVEKFLHLQDSVPCKIRAKRGCATHPRSIAERLRRTRISERMRKLQELVPNMDKQTNTADMLDLAVDYIKDLQKQYKILNEKRAKCKCLNGAN